MNPMPPISAAKVVDPIAVLDGSKTVVLFLKIQHKILCGRKFLVPLPLRLPIDGAHAMTILQELCNEMPADETPGASD